MSEVLLDTLTIQELLTLIERYKREERVITLHPNGFLQLPLTETGEKRMEGFQLHVWKEEIGRRGAKMFEVHDHAFVIDSHVLVGSLINTTYRVVDDPNGIFFVFEGDGTGQLGRTSHQVSCKVQKTETISAGQSYIIPKGTFHSSEKNASLVATIIKKFDIDRTYKSKVIAPATYLEDRIEIDRTIDQQIAWKAVREVEDRLKKR